MRTFSLCLLMVVRAMRTHTYVCIPGLHISIATHLIYLPVPFSPTKFQRYEARAGAAPKFPDKCRCSFAPVLAPEANYTVNCSTSRYAYIQRQLSTCRRL